MNVSTSEERAALTVEDIVDGESEEAMINNPPVLEDEEERHRSREPLVCILQSINSVNHSDVHVDDHNLMCTLGRNHPHPLPPLILPQ